MFKNHKRHSNKHHFIQNAINKSCCHFFSICTPFSPICQQSILQWMFDDKSSNKHTHTMESKFTFPFQYFGWHVSITSTPYPFSWTHPRSPCLTDSITLSSCHHGFHNHQLSHDLYKLCTIFSRQFFRVWCLFELLSAFSDPQLCHLGCI